jgi:hypothetical protein
MSNTLFATTELVLLHKALQYQQNGMADAISGLASSAISPEEWIDISLMCNQQSDIAKMANKDFNYNLGIYSAKILKEAVHFFLETVEISLEENDDTALNELFAYYIILGKLEAIIHFNQ